MKEASASLFKSGESMSNGIMGSSLFIIVLMQPRP